MEKGALLSIQHPHVQALVATWADTQALHFLMPLADAGELWHQLRQGGQHASDTSAVLLGLDPAVAVHWLWQAVSGVCATHAAGYIHRDVKTENVVLHALPCGAKIARLIDYGTAKCFLPGCAPVPEFAGTPEFISPEVVSGADSTPAQDLWALGVMAYQLVVGALPYQANSAYLTMASAGRHPPAVPCYVPAALQDLIAGLLQVPVEDREQFAWGSGSPADVIAREGLDWTQQWPALTGHPVWAMAPEVVAATHAECLVEHPDVGVPSAALAKLPPCWPEPPAPSAEHELAGELAEAAMAAATAGDANAWRDIRQRLLDSHPGVVQQAWHIVTGHERAHEVRIAAMFAPPSLGTSLQKCSAVAQCWRVGLLWTAGREWSFSSAFAPQTTWTQPFIFSAANAPPAAIAALALPGLPPAPDLPDVTWPAQRTLLFLSSPPHRDSVTPAEACSWATHALALRGANAQAVVPVHGALDWVGNTRCTNALPAPDTQWVLTPATYAGFAPASSVAAGGSWGAWVGGARVLRVSLAALDARVVGQSVASKEYLWIKHAVQTARFAAQHVILHLSEPLPSGAPDGLLLRLLRHCCHATSNIRLVLWETPDEPGHDTPRSLDQWLARVDEADASLATDVLELGSESEAEGSDAGDDEGGAAALRPQAHVTPEDTRAGGGLDSALPQATIVYLPPCSVVDVFVGQYSVHWSTHSVHI